jgi:phosphoserine phosphatase
VNDRRPPAPTIPDEPPPYDAVLFDCDSTLCALEGVDALADVLPARDRQALQALTERAMAGELPLEAVYAARLERLRPDRDAIEALAQRYLATLLPGMAELIERLRAAGVEVALISGGLAPALAPLAAQLGIGPERLFAVDVHFDGDGRYMDFERNSPLARSGGKRTVVEAFARGRGHRRLALVGDGATDLEAAPVLARFVAFGAVAERPAVFAGAHAHNRVRRVADLAARLLPAS